jgi:hypothetical protein
MLIFTFGNLREAGFALLVLAVLTAWRFAPALFTFLSVVAFLIFFGAVHVAIFATMRPLRGPLLHLYLRVLWLPERP